MRKEVIFALFFGTLFGLIVAFGVWRLNSAVSPKESQAQSEADAKTETPAAESANTLAINKPSEYSVFGDPEISINGITKSNSWVVVSTDANDAIAKASANGSFDIKIRLSSGLNLVSVASFDESGKKSEQKILLVYSSQYFEGANSKEESTDQKVQKRIENTQNPITAYAGTITDIAETTLHIKNGGEELKQASTRNDTTYANENTEKEMAFTDLAIGDFIIAMGTKSDNQVLSAGRVVVSKAPTNPQHSVHWGEVVEITGNTLTLSQVEGHAELTFGKSWKGPEKKEIAEKDKLLVVAAEDKNTIRTLEILE